MIKVSVIVPVYNVELYLEKCLESIIHQSLSDIEIICIEDCSTDNSKKILEEYSRKSDKVIVLYNEENQGLSCARNRGIAEAKGEYIQFVDSDDWLEYDALEKYYSIAKENELDLLRTNFQYVYMSGEIQKSGLQYSNEYISQPIEGFDGIVEFMINMNMHCWNYAWLDFVKRDYLISNSICFFKNIYYEDVLFTFDLLMAEPRLMCINEVGYQYRIREQSILSMKANDKHVYGYLTCYYQMVQGKMLENKKNYTKYFLLLYLERIQRALMRIIKKVGVDNIVTDSWPVEISDFYKIIVRSYSNTNYIDELKISQIVGQMTQYRDVYIFGAGEVAKELIVYLNSNYKEIIIDGIVVTDTESNRKTLFGYEIISIEQLAMISKEVLIIVAISNRFCEGIVDTLYNKGFSNIICVC